MGSEPSHTYRKMRAVFLALVILPAAIASSSGSATTGYASAYSSASDSSSSYASAATSSSVGTIQVVKASLKLPGVTVTAFDKSTDSGKKLRTAFKAAVALGLKICGTSGTAQCSGTDVVITSVSRRRGDATVEFYVKTASAAAASSGATALTSYVQTGTTFVDNLKSEAKKQGVSSVVANVKTPVFTVAPKAATKSVPAPTPTPTVSGAGKTAVAAGVTVALAGLSMLW